MKECTDKCTTDVCYNEGNISYKREYTKGYTKENAKMEANINLRRYEVEWTNVRIMRMNELV